MRKAYCNKCGKEIGPVTQDCNTDFSIDTYITYGSIYDGWWLSLDLCSSCMDELIASCKISPVRPWAEPESMENCEENSHE